ncbi:MAG: FtsW/RodA/SpoVE family cell cycle protein, partial [Limnochordia bacterium]
MFTKGGKPDLILFLAVIALVSLGLIMVFSASSVMGLADAGNPYYYVQRQSILAVLGLVILFVLMKVDYHIFKPLALPGLVISLALLVLVLFVGTGAGSASRWIRIAGFNLQPSELAKLILVNYVAVYLANKRARARKFFSGLLP